MQRIIAGGTGLIGKRLVAHWLQQQHDIIVVGRSKKRIQDIFGNRVQALSWEQLTTQLLQSAELIVNLAGESIGTKRWTKLRKQQILNSRVDTTSELARLLAPLGAASPPLFNASAVGIYGLQQSFVDRLPPPLTENTPINHPKDFLSLVGQQWERAANPAIDRGVRVIFLRFGVALAKEGGALPKLMQPFEYYLGGPIGSGYQPFSWVAIADVIRAIEFLMNHPETTGPFNIVSPQCVQQAIVAKTIAKVLKRPDAVRLPAWLIELLFGEMGRELLLEGQHVYPLRLHEMNFKFHYAEIETALNKIVKEAVV